MRFLKITLLFLATLVFAAACGNSGNAPADNSKAEASPSAEVSQTPDEVALGKSKYQEYCNKCHKEDGKGGTVEIKGRTIKPHNLVSDKMKGEPDSEFIKAMEDGFPEDGMPSFKGTLTPDEMKAVVKYIREDLQ